MCLRRKDQTWEEVISDFQLSIHIQILFYGLLLRCLPVSSCCDAASLCVGIWVFRGLLFVGCCFIGNNRKDERSLLTSVFFYFVFVYGFFYFFLFDQISSFFVAFEMIKRLWRSV